MINSIKTHTGGIGYSEFLTYRGEVKTFKFFQVANLNVKNYSEDNYLIINAILEAIKKVQK